MAKARFSVNQSLWIRGDEICRTQRNAINETQALQARGARVFLFKGVGDREGWERLKKILVQTDTHVVLSWLHPKELNALRPLLAKRKNFSMLTDDWYIHPYWCLRDADYIIFRKYQGIAVRLGKAPFLTGGRPPFLLDPRPDVSRYPVACAMLRPGLVAISPLVDAWRYWLRKDEEVDPARLLYFPFAIDPADVPVGNGELKYDFANTGGVLGIFMMRDAYTPFGASFANLYEDRRRLLKAIAAHENQPFKFFDCLRERSTMRLPYREYIRKCQESRFLITSGGLHDATVPKYSEYVCVGTPMIGRSLPFEYPWLDDCLFPVDMLGARPDNIKPQLERALEAYPRLRANCLNWREKLLKLYELPTLLDMVQEQADGKPVRPGYLKSGVSTVVGGSGDGK